MARIRFVTGGALAGGLFQGLMQQGREQQPPLEPGTVIGRFRIEGLIDQGGAASVYRAERCDEAFRQSVALKVTHKPVADATQLAHEHNALGRLRHPVIATILDGGALEDGRAWMAIELVDGVPLDEWCRQARPGWRERVSLLCRIADGLVYAHGRGVAHCDIKPTNVLVTHEGEPKLIDFGIAAEDGGLAPAMSTPGFASPEQRAGQPGSPLSDIYQLGLLLDLLVRPSDERLADIERDGPRRASLGAIVDKAMQPMADQRYASIADMRQDLQRVLADRPVHARRNSPATIAYWSLRRNRRAASVGVVLMAVLAIATLHFRDSLSSSFQQRDRATQSAIVSQNFLGQIIEIASAGDRKSALQLIDETAVRAASTADSRPEQYANTARLLADAYLNIGESERARELLRRALDRLPDGNGLARANLLMEMARLHAFVGNAAAARTAADAAGRLQRHEVRSGSLESARLGMTLAEVSFAENQPEPALRHAQQSISQLQRLNATGSSDFVRALVVAAYAQHRLGRYDEAQQTYRRAAELAKGLHGPTAAIALKMERDMLGLQLMHGNTAGAEESLARQRSFILLLHGADSLEYADLLASYGLLAWSQAQFSDAARHFSDQIALLESHETVDPRALPNALHNLADALYEMERFEEARENYRRANAFRQQRGMGQGHPAAIGFLREVASACELQQPGAALARFTDVHARLRAALPRGHQSLATAKVLEARCLWRNGKAEEARRVFTTARKELAGADLDPAFRRRMALWERDLGLSPEHPGSRPAAH